MIIVRKAKTLIRIIITKLMMSIVKIFYQVEKNKVLFFSDVRDVLDGNLKYMYDILDDSIYKKEICFKADRKIKRTMKQQYHAMKQLLTSQYILLDDFSSSISIMSPRSGQKIVQLWHAEGAFKTFGFSRTDKKNSNKFNSHRNYTHAITSSDAIRGCYAEGFNMPITHIKATGIPRTDIFFNHEIMEKKRKEIYDEFPEFKDKKVILFAPTYRGNSLAKSYYDFSQLSIDELYNQLGDDYVFIFKWHPGHYFKMKENNERPYNLEKYPDFFYDFSQSRDINDLLLITDVLITDYSSVIFDYLFMNKPIVYFAYDLEEYVSNQGRGLYYDFEKYVYGDVAKDESSLIKAIKAENICEEKRSAFNKLFMEACDGHSTKKVYDWIFKQ